MSDRLRDYYDRLSESFADDLAKLEDSENYDEDLEHERSKLSQDNTRETPAGAS